jgi:hypothetical protein
MLLGRRRAYRGADCNSIDSFYATAFVHDDTYVQSDDGSGCRSLSSPATHATRWCAARSTALALACVHSTALRADDLNRLSVVAECIACSRACISLLPVRSTCRHFLLPISSWKSLSFVQLCEAFSSRHRLDLGSGAAVSGVSDVMIRMEEKMRQRQKQREDAVAAAQAAAEAATAAAAAAAAEKEAKLKAEAAAAAAQEEAQRRSLALEHARWASFIS